MRSKAKPQKFEAVKVIGDPNPKPLLQRVTVQMDQSAPAAATVAKVISAEPESYAAMMRRLAGQPTASTRTRVASPLRKAT